MADREDLLRALWETEPRAIVPADSRVQVVAVRRGYAEDDVRRTFEMMDSTRAHPSLGGTADEMLAGDVEERYTRALGEARLAIEETRKGVRAAREQLAAFAAQYEAKRRELAAAVELIDELVNVMNFADVTYCRDDADEAVEKARAFLASLKDGRTVAEVLPGEVFP